MRVLAGLIVVSCAIAQQSGPVFEDAQVRILEGKFIEPHSEYIRVPMPGVFIHPQQQVVIELLQKQGAPRNVCKEILQGAYLHCHDPGPEWLGADLQIQFETDRTHIGILQIAPGATLAIPAAFDAPVLIALEGMEAEAIAHANGAPASSSSRRKLSAANVLRSPADQVTEIRNTGKSPARFLVVVFGGLGE